MTTGSQAIQHLCMSCAPRSGCVLSVVGPEALNGGRFNFSLLRFERGETLFLEGTPALGWAVLCRGRAKLVARPDRGRRLLLRFCGPGELLAGSTSGTYPYSALAVAQATVAFIPGADVAILARWHPEVLVEASRRAAEEQRRLVRRLADLAYGSVRTRLVRVLLEIGDEHGVAEDDGLRIEPLSLTDLAEMIGAARPTTSLELQSLAKCGLIVLAWPTVFLLDPDGLRRIQVTNVPAA